jgi:hypothetical protein
MGTIKIITYRKMSRNNSTNIIELYDEECFKIVKKARSSNGCPRKKRTYKTKN